VFKWSPYPYLRIVFFFAAGIFTYIRVNYLPAFALPLFTALLLAYLVFWVLARIRKSADGHNLAGMAALLAFYLAGFIQTHLLTAKSRTDNIIHYQSESITYYVGVVNDYITHKPNTLSTTLALTQIRSNGTWKRVSGNVRITLKNGTGTEPVKYGTVLLVKGAPNLVQPPLNPDQFNYQQYLAQGQIYHQHYLNASQFIVAGQKPPHALVQLSIQLRGFLDAQLRKNIPSEREYGIATALILGIKDYLPEDIKTTYANTGTMHVLAVSGLHVALLFWILNLLVGRWSERKGFKVLSFLLLLGIIWLYGFVTALSASVLRAVVMFSLISFAKTFRKQANMYNTLAAAAFILLLYNPYFLLDVGFQLSFLAVVGIVYFQPKIYNWLEGNAWLPDKIWALVSTSLAAQLAVLPLSFYYFHQFPVYFLLANIAAIFLSNIALVVGFLLLGFCWLPVVPALLGQVITYSLSLMNYISNLLLHLPLAVISGISISQTQAWLLYGMLILLCFFLALKRLTYFTLFTICWLIFSGLQLTEAKSRQQQQLLVIYHVPRATAMGFVAGNSLTLYADSAFYINPKNLQYNLQPHWWKLGVKPTAHLYLDASPLHANVPVTTLPDGNKLFSWQGLKIIYCQKAIKGYDLTALKPDYLVISKNAYLNPANFSGTKHKITIVVTGANYQQYTRKLNDRVSKIKNVQLHVTAEKGALVVAVPNRL